MENLFGITREEVLNLASQKLADQFADEDSLHGLAHKIIYERVEKTFKETVGGEISLAIQNQMEILLGEEINPVNIFGQPTGKPTTMRGVMAERAFTFWNEKVNSEGKVSNDYYGKPRHEWLFSKIVGEEFNKAVKQNIVNLVGGFKDALSKSANQITKEHIDSLIRVKTQND